MMDEEHKWLLATLVLVVVVMVAGICLYVSSPDPVVTVVCPDGETFNVRTPQTIVCVPE